jgi:hypothetical protein
MPSRFQRHETFQLIDCTIFNLQFKLGLDADGIDFTTELFERRVHIPGGKPADETLKILQRYREAALKAAPGTKEIQFRVETDYFGEKKRWTCKVRAYLDEDNLRVLEFSE